MTRTSVLSELTLLECEQILEIMDFHEWASAYLVKVNGKWELFCNSDFKDTTIKIMRNEVEQHIWDFRC